MNYRQKIGKFGEKLAVDYLIKHGYRIIETNVKISYKEIDVIANFKDKIIFIEVKTRTSKIFGSADDGMSSKKLHHLKKALNMYVDSKNLDPENIRLDLLAIDIDKYKKVAKIKHYKDIF